jgi:phosphatidyl-myo-inositol dimannoside synthase
MESPDSNKPTKLKVLVLTHEFHPRHGGIATYAEEVARATANLGFEVTVWAPIGRGGPEPKWPFRVERLSMRGTHDLPCLLKTASKLFRERARLQSDIVYVPEPGPMLALSWLRVFPSLRPKRLVLTFHGSEILRFAQHDGRRRRIGRLIEDAERVSAPSQFTHRLLTEQFPQACSKAFLTPGALRTGFPTKLRPPRPSGSKTIILTVGRLHPRKGHAYIIRALAALPPEQRQNVEYWLAGSGRREDYGRYLSDLAEQLGVPMQLLGPLSADRLEQAYQRADIFAMTSINHRHSVEGFGLVYLEAAAHGLPVVAHSVGGVPEAVQDGVSGLLVPPGDGPALAKALGQLIADPELRRRFGEKGRDWARQNSWTRSAELLFNRQIEITDS